MDVLSGAQDEHLVSDSLEDSPAQWPTKEINRPEQVSVFFIYKKGKLFNVRFIFSQGIGVAVRIRYWNRTLMAVAIDIGEPEIGAKAKLTYQQRTLPVKPADGVTAITTEELRNQKTTRNRQGTQLYRVLEGKRKL